MSEQAATIVSVIVGIVVVAIVYIVPFWMAWRAYRRGYPGWAWATGVSALFGIGLIVGGIALVMARKEVGPKVECPECGELARAVGSITLNRETGEEVKTPILGVLALIGGIALDVFAGWLAVSLVLNPLPSNVNVGSPCTTVGFAFAIGSSMAGWGGKTLAQRKVDKLKNIKYRCRACKHRWTMQVGVDGVVVPLSTAPTTAAQPVSAAQEEAADGAETVENCWYCESRRATAGAYVEEKMYDKGSGPSGETTVVRVPRCASCQAIHTGNDKLMRGMSTGLVILGLASCILPMWISYMITDKTNVALGIGIGLVVSIAGFVGLVKWNASRLEKQGIKGAVAHKQEHPEVLALKERGWDFGASPKS
jgi:hypothetical protein